MGRLMPWGLTHGLTHRVCQVCVGQEFQRASRLMCHESTYGSTHDFSNMHIFQNISPKIIKFLPMDHKSFVLSLYAFKSGFDKIMILLLKSNVFFKRKLLVPLQMFCNHQNQSKEQQDLLETLFRR